MQGLFTYVVWVVFASMSLRFGIYFGTDYDIGIVSPILIVIGLQILISPYFIKK